MDILLNNKKVNFVSSDFPILISGVDKSGASFFSICLLANLLKNGFKVLLFSAYPAAKEEFKKQAGENDRALIIESGEEQVFLETIKNVPDINDRVILIKNIENYSLKLLKAVKNARLVIFSGNLDKCEFSNELIKEDFKTKIFFSSSNLYYQDGVTDLPKYFGKIISDRYQGLISLKLAKS